MNESEKIIQLLRQPRWSDADIEWLVNYIDSDNGNEEFRELMQERFIMRMEQQQPARSARAMEMLKELHTKMEISETPQVPVHRVHFLKTAWFKYPTSLALRWASAAAIVIIVGIGSYLYITNQNEKPPPAEVLTKAGMSDRPPGGNKATLTLADGSKIVLDSAKNGTIANERQAVITKKGDQILYASRLTPHASREITYNTMTTPRGGQYQLTLPDGTRVWLNAESSITYPTAFAERERRVSVKGEVYFEVTKDKSKPFIVSVGTPHASRLTPHNEGLDIEVLGTHFNINAYTDEPTINTTLLEGSVRITLGAAHAGALAKAVHTSLILKPGQQGQLKNQELVLAKDPNISQVIAWKNGTFDFQNMELEAAMRQIERWYDVEVIYTTTPPKITLGGGLGRDLKLSQVLKMLEGVDVKTRIENKKLYISQ